MSRKSKIEGMTLLELILAVLLLNVVILTGISMELGLRRIYRSTDLEIQLLDEASPILAMVTKDINRGIGYIFDLPYRTASIAASACDTTYQIRIDSNNNAMFDPGDGWVSFRYMPSTCPSYPYYLLYHDIDGNVFLLSNKVTAFSISPPSADGTSTIILQLRKDPAVAASYTNPQINLETSVQYRETSFSI